MFIKKIFIYCLVLSFTITSIYSKIEEDRKFLSLNPITYLNEEQEVKSFAEDHKLINIKCLFSKDYNIYSLQELQNEDDDYKIKHDEETIKFNFCQNTKKVQNATFYKYENNTEDNITRLSGSIDGEGENKNTWEQNENKTGVIIHFIQGDQCKENETEKYHVILEVECDADVDKEKFKENPSQFMTISNDSTPCTYLIKMKSLYGCSLKSSYLLTKLFEDYKIIFAIIFVVFGLFLCIKGNGVLAITLMLLCGIVGCYALTAFILNAFPNFITTEIWLFACLGVTFVLGCLVGFVLKGNVKIAIILFGGFLGYSCAIFVYQIVLNYVEFDPQIVYYVCIGVCIVIGALIAWKLNRVIIIIGTSVFGGYLAMRGISFIAGNYLDEGYIIDLLKNKEFEQLKEIRDGWSYAYLGSWIILSIIGIYIQCKNKDKDEAKN